MWNRFRNTTTDASASLGLLIIRVIFAFSMIYGHGYPKLMKFFSDEPLSFSDPIGLGMATSLVLVTFAEFFCSILVALGWFTRLAVIPLIIAMVVVVFVSQAGESFGKIEKPLLFLACFVGLLFTGAGRYSLDGLSNRDAK